MRLLVAADIHGFENVYQWIAAQAASLGVDVVVLAGDILGVPDGFETIEHAMQASARRIVGILNSIDCPVLYIMGNDDLVDLATGTDHCRSIHGHRLDLGGFSFVGYQCGPPFMKGPSERSDAELATELEALGDLVDDGTVLVTHYPASGILDGGFGLSAIRDLVDGRPPLIHVHGHSHGDFGRTANHFNVASAGRERAMAIDLEARTYQVVDRRGVCPSLPW